VISVNDQLPVVVSKGGTLTVRPGDVVNVLHIEANYERGLTCDLLGMGSVNDLRQPFRITRSTRVVVRKDHQRIGTVRIQVARGPRPFTTVRSTILYFLVEVEGQRRVIADGERLQVVAGDRLRLVDVLTNLPNQQDLQVNFKGFVPAGGGPNQGEDRGHTINTATDLMPRYSRCRKPSRPQGVACYQVVASLRGRVVGRMTVEVVPARLDYLVLKRSSGHKLVYHNGETVRARPGEHLEVVDLKTNVRPDERLHLALDGRGKRLPLSGRRIELGPRLWRRLSARGGGEVRLVVLREKQAIGHVRLQIGGR
jgi:hypothetical protein